MLKTKLLHPDILKALGSNGHGARILIADGNFPISTNIPDRCKKVFLNLCPGLLKVTDVLQIIKDYIQIENGIIMIPQNEAEQPIYDEFKQILGEGMVLKRQKRFEFYRETRSEDTCLAIATGETRRFANILIVIGSIMEPV